MHFFFRKSALRYVKSAFLKKKLIFLKRKLRCFFQKSRIFFWKFEIFEQNLSSNFLKVWFFWIKVFYKKIQVWRKKRELCAKKMCISHPPTSFLDPIELTLDFLCASLLFEIKRVPKTFGDFWNPFTAIQNGWSRVLGTAKEQRKDSLPPGEPSYATFGCARWSWHTVLRSFDCPAARRRCLAEAKVGAPPRSGPRRLRLKPNTARGGAGDKSHTKSFQNSILSRMARSRGLNSL